MTGKWSVFSSCHDVLDTSSYTVNHYPVHGITTLTSILCHHQKLQIIAYHLFSSSIYLSSLLLHLLHTIWSTHVGIVRWWFQSKWYHWREYYLFICLQKLSNISQCRFRMIISSNMEQEEKTSVPSFAYYYVIPIKFFWSKVINST